MSEPPHESPVTSSGRARPTRLIWLPALLGVIPGLFYLAAKACGGSAAVSALSGATTPDPRTAMLGGIYLGSWLATATLSPALLIASFLLWGWERARILRR